jgi:hypothetical protein
MNQAHLDDAQGAVPTTANGLIVVDGVQYFVKVFFELLYLDAVSWFEHLRGRHQLLISGGEDDSDQEFTDCIREVIAQIEELLEQERYVRMPGLWPMIDTRAKLPIWKVTNEDEMRRYASSVIDCAEYCDENSEMDFAIVIADKGVSRLFVTERWKSPYRFTGDYVEARMISAASMAALVEQVKSCPDHAIHEIDIPVMSDQN